MLSPVHMRAQEITAASLLRDAGYAAALIGKWHMNGIFNLLANPSQTATDSSIGSRFKIMRCPITGIPAGLWFKSRTGSTPPVARRPRPDISASGDARHCCTGIRTSGPGIHAAVNFTGTMPAGVPSGTRKSTR